MSDAHSGLPAPLAGIPRERWPRHVAVIMDGNGRWAQARGLPRAAGHREAAETAPHQVPEAASGEAGGEAGGSRTEDSDRSGSSEPLTGDEAC